MGLGSQALQFYLLLENLFFMPQTVQTTPQSPLSVHLAGAA